MGRGTGVATRPCGASVQDELQNDDGDGWLGWEIRAPTEVLSHFLAIERDKTPGGSTNIAKLKEEVPQELGPIAKTPVWYTPDERGPQSLVTHGSLKEDPRSGPERRGPYPHSVRPYQCTYPGAQVAPPCELTTNSQGDAQPAAASCPSSLPAPSWAPYYLPKPGLTLEQLPPGYLTQGWSEVSRPITHRAPEAYAESSLHNPDASLPLSSWSSPAAHQSSPTAALSPMWWHPSHLPPPVVPALQPASLPSKPLATTKSPATPPSSKWLTSIPTPYAADYTPSPQIDTLRPPSHHPGGVSDKAHTAVSPSATFIPHCETSAHPFSSGFTAPHLPNEPQGALSGFQDPLRRKQNQQQHTGRPLRPPDPFDGLSLSEVLRTGSRRTSEKGKKMDPENKSLAPL